MRTALLAIALAIAAPAFAQQTYTRPGTLAPNVAEIQGCSGDARGCIPVPVTGTLNSAGAADTVGSSATFNGNTVCATVLLAGQLGAGFFLGAGTSAATYTPSLSQDATPAAPGCTGGNWIASAFVDTSGNASATISTTNPNAFQQFGIKTLAGSRCARVCTGSSGTTGSATGLLIATTVPSPPPAAGADVTDRDGRLLGHVHVDSVPSTPVTGPLTDTQLRASAVPVSNATLPLPAGASTEATLALIKTDVDKIPTSPATDRTTAASPFSVRLSDGAAFYDPRAIRALTPIDTITVDSGFITPTGSLGQTLTQTPTNFNLKTELAVGATLIDPRSIRALTSSDVVTVNNPFALDATLTGGTQKAILRGGAKGATAAADVTSTAEGADHQAVDVQLWLSGSALDPRTRSWTLASGTDSVAAVQSGTWTVQQGGAPWSVSQSGIWTTGRTWSLLNTTDSVNAVQSGVWNLTNITGTISLPTNAAQETGGNLATLASKDFATSAKQDALMATVAETHAATGAAVAAKSELSGGMDPTGSQRPMAVSPAGSVYVLNAAPTPPLNPLLQRCNAVRRSNCQP